MSSLFRKEAIDNHSSGSEATIAVRSIPIRWLVFITATIICAAVFVIWLVGGTVYESVSLQGIVWPDKSYGELYAETSGIIAKTTVSVGDTVKAGDILAFVPDSESLEHAELSEEHDLYSEYDRKSVIRSKINGIVTYIIDRNSYVTPGDRIASVVAYDENGNNDIVTAFVPEAESDLLYIGMEARIMPDNTPLEQYGYIVGYVSAVADYPLKGEQIYNSYKQFYMPGMDQDANYVQVRITLMHSSEEGGGLKWSKSTGENRRVFLGTRCAVDVILQKNKPYRWLLRWSE